VFAACGYDLTAPDAVASWEAQHWEVAVRPDRSYYEMTEPKGIDFPTSPHTRRIPLVGDFVSIGRHSTSKGVQPEIDLSGLLEDIGVSHTHAVLMRQPDGCWALVDQGSTNGSFLNSDRDPVPANEPVPLNDGDQIHVGAWTTLTIERSGVSDGDPSNLDFLPSKDTRAMARGRHLALQIDLLGPLQVAVANAPIAIGASKARAVLASLALHMGTDVSAGALEQALWGDEEPRTANKALQGYISSLRRLLPRGAIETTPRGYRLVGPKSSVDVFRFERHCRRGRELLTSGHPGLAVAELGQALDLWRGDPLPDLADGPAGATEVGRLREHRASAEEDLFEARLELGDHHGVVPDASTAVQNEPLRQRRWAELMLALHRSGRQVEALRAFQRLRQLLGDEFGVEPSAEMLALERAIVLDKSELQWIPSNEAGDPAPGISAKGPSATS
jgi:DNA-binding SARP family transcriptional activator